MISKRKFRLTQEHIDNGVPCDIRRCIFALCLQSYCPPGITCEVACSIVGFWNGKKYLTTINLPPEVIQVRYTFDCGGKDFVHPFEFELEGNWEFLGR